MSTKLFPKHPSSSATNAGDSSTNRTLFAETKGRRIAYRSIGTGEPMILCNRFRGNLDKWDPAFLDALAENYTVITFNHSGFASSTGAPNVTALGFAQDIVDLAEALQIEKFIVGGWSLGAFVAQIVVTEFPQLVSRAILIGTKPPGENVYDIEQIFKDTAYKPSYTIEDETILFFEPTSNISVDAAKESHARISRRTIDLDPEIGPELWNNYMLCGGDFIADPYDARHKITVTTIPMLVISADHEVCFPPENWFALNRKLPTTQVMVIPQSGHGVQHQYPQLVADYIHAFLQQNQ